MTHFFGVSIAFFSSVFMMSTMISLDGAIGHGKDTVSAEILEKFKPRPIDAPLAQKLEVLLKLRSPGLGIPSNDGNKITCSWGLGQVSQIYEFDLKAETPAHQRITNESQPVSLVAVTADEKYTVAMIDQDGTETPGIYLIDRHSRSQIQVFHKPKVEATALHVSKNGKSIYFRANDGTDRRDFNLYRYDIETKALELVFTKRGYYSISDFDDDSGRMIISANRTNTIRDNFLYDPASRVFSDLLGPGEDQDYIMAFANEPGTYFVTTSKFGDFVRLYRWAGGNKDNPASFEAISPDSPFEIEGFQLDPNRTMLLLSVNDAGYHKVLLYDAKTLRPLKAPQLLLDGGIADQTTAGSFSANGRYQAFGILTYDKPASRYIYDWQQGSSRKWFEPKLDGIVLSKSTPDTLEYYPAEDGTQIPMFVRRPLDHATKNYPVLVHFHGGPEGQSIPGFSVMIQSLVDAGFIVVQPNVRGSEGYGRKWLDADNGAKRLEVISDIKACADFVRKNWTRDQPLKIGIFGGSYGGYATLIGMTMYAGSYDAGVSIVGISNLITFLQNTDDARRYVREPEYGYLGKDDEILKKLSPITYIDRVQGPLMIIQGANDPRVPVTEAVQVYDALRSHGINSELTIFADEGHGSAKQSNTVLEIGQTIEFFNRQLKP